MVLNSMGGVISSMRTGIRMRRFSPSADSVRTQMDLMDSFDHRVTTHLASSNAFSITSGKNCPGSML